MVNRDILEKYEVTIGIECHVQLKTVSKLFSGADNDARDASPNSKVSPIDYGLPGMLPVLNREAVTLAIRAALALNSRPAPMSRFDRKHYFYPDLPKGYQISQMYHPTIGPGQVEVPLDSPADEGDSFVVRIHHAHIEEDAGKLVHSANSSGVDLNRAGTPLIEIVSEPDMHSPAQAKAYANELYLLMTYADVTYGDLYHGNMRFDVNVSVAPKGSTLLGTRAEIKNLNSFRSVEKAAQYEYERQVELIEKGERIVQETRGWDDAKGRTTSQRSKEDAQEYRYMPDADIPPVIITDEQVDNIRETMPKLPDFYRVTWQPLLLDNSVVNALLSNRRVAEAMSYINDISEPKTTARIAHWFASSSESMPEDAKIREDALIELSGMVEKNELSSTGAKEVFTLLFTSDQKPREIAESKNLLQVSDDSFITEVVSKVLADPSAAKAVEDLKNGNEKVIGFLVGQVMKQSQGKANPGLAQTEIRKQLGL